MHFDNIHHGKRFLNLSTKSLIMHTLVGLNSSFLLLTLKLSLTKLKKRSTMLRNLVIKTVREKYSLRNQIS